MAELRELSEQGKLPPVLLFSLASVEATQDFYAERWPDARVVADPKKELAPFKAFRLVDHMDAVLALSVERVVSALCKEGPDRPVADLGDEPVKSVRKLPVSLRQDLMTLGALYDRADVDGTRASRLRRVLKLAPPRGSLLWQALEWGGWLPAALVGFGASASPGETVQQVLMLLAAVLLVAYLGVLVKRLLVDRLLMRSLAGKVRDSMSALPRTRESIAASLRWLDPGQRRGPMVPWHEVSDEALYASLDALRRVLARFGYTGVLVLIDRVDEPALVNGDPDKMRELMWPLFNSKFLQQDRFGVLALDLVEIPGPYDGRSGGIGVGAFVPENKRRHGARILQMEICAPYRSAPRPCHPPNCRPATLGQSGGEKAARSSV